MRLLKTLMYCVSVKEEQQDTQYFKEKEGTKDNV